MKLARGSVLDRVAGMFLPRMKKGERGGVLHGVQKGGKSCKGAARG